MSDHIRKAVITLNQVQAAFLAYQTVRTAMGDDITGHTFDRGARGKGFAQYDTTDAVVRTFDSKEDALSHYGRYTDVAREVMEVFSVGLYAPAEEAESAEEAQEEATKVPAQRRGKAKVDA